MSEPMRDEVELPELPKWTKAEEREATLGSHPELSFGWLFLAKFERESQLQAALSANREKDAEIARLKKDLEESEQQVFIESEKTRHFELENISLRALGREKWIDVKQELPPNDSRIETIDMREPFPELTADHMGVNHSDLRRWEKIGTHFTHWRIVAPPTLTGVRRC